MNRVQIADAIWTYFKAAVFALVVGTFVGSIVVSVVWLAVQRDFSAANFGGSVAAMSLYGLLIAIPVVCVYGIPLYALLNKFKLASWPAAFLFGSLPGALWVFRTNESWVDPVLVNGICIAMAFHAFMRQTASKQLNARPRVRHAAH